MNGLIGLNAGGIHLGQADKGGTVVIALFLQLDGDDMFDGGLPIGPV